MAVPNSVLDDSALGGAVASPATSPFQEASHKPDPSLDRAASGASLGGGGGSGGLQSRRSGWGSAKVVLHGVKASTKFQTLRDLIGTDAYIDETRLRMLKALGEGAFAKVQQAELLPSTEPDSPTTPGGSLSRPSVDLRPRMVAVKILREELLLDPEQVQLFVKEVSLLRRLRHPCIVRFVGCSWQRGEDGSAHGGVVAPHEMYYVQEYCAGGSLGDLVRKQMVQPFKRMYSDVDALRWSLDVARALQYLHESLPVVIHRDLKLENVMLSSEDISSSKAKLGDFGLARLTPPSEQEKLQRVTRMLSQPKKDWSSLSSAARQLSSRGLDKMLDRMLTNTTERSQRTAGLSSPSSFISSTTTWAEVSHRAMTGKTGSFGYMAPEVSRNQQYNAKADIFSLGMVMYNLFNRTIPTVQILLNGDESHLELYAAKVADGYRPPMLATVPAGARAAIEACWKGDADLRPTAAEVVERLVKLQESGEIAAEPAKAGGGCSCTVM